MTWPSWCFADAKVPTGTSLQRSTPTKLTVPGPACRNRRQRRPRPATLDQRGHGADLAAPGLLPPGLPSPHKFTGP